MLTRPSATPRPLSFTWSPSWMKLRTSPVGSCAEALPPLVTAAMQKALRVGERPIHNACYTAATADRDRSARTDAEEDDFNGLQKHHEIEGEAMVLHVIQVVFEFFLGLHLRGTVAVAHLGPPGDARLHEMPFRVIRNRLCQFLDEGRTLGARADEAHLPGEDVEHLRQLVDPEPAEPGADSRDAGIVAARPDRLPLRLRIDPHAPELQHREPPPVLPRADLAIQNRAAVFKEDCDRRQQGDRRGREQDRDADDHVEQALARQSRDVATKAIREDEPARLHQLDAYPPGLSLEESENVVHRDAAQAAFQQFPGGKAAPPVIHRHHDFLDLVAHRQVQEVTVELQDLMVRNADAITRRSHVADDLETALVGASA